MPKPIVDIYVEYDTRGERRRKRFDDAYAARRFYVAKFKAGKNPRVLDAKHITQETSR